MKLTPVQLVLAFGFVALTVSCSDASDQRTSSEGARRTILTEDGTPAYSRFTTSMCPVSTSSTSSTSTSTSYTYPTSTSTSYTYPTSTSVAYSTGTVTSTSSTTSTTSLAYADYADFAVALSSMTATSTTSSFAITSIEKPKIGDYNCKKSDWFDWIKKNKDHFTDATKALCETCTDPADDDHWPCAKKSKELADETVKVFGDEWKNAGNKCPEPSINNPLTDAVITMFKYNNVGWTMAASGGCYTACGLAEEIGRWLDYNTEDAKKYPAGSQMACLYQHMIYATKSLKSDAETACKASKT